MRKLFIAFLFIASFIPSPASATSFYIDFTNGSPANNGLATTTAFNSLDAFMEVARSAGDIAFVRRGQATTTNISDVNPTSSGTLNNPIIVSSDDDNLWNDFATSTQTYTPVPGTKTMTASAAITGIAANDWVYVAGDGVTASTADCFETYNTTARNTCSYMYEVASVSGTTLTLYLPYLGGQTAAGLYLRVMPDAPIWNTTSGDFEFLTANDNYWYFRGLDLRSTDSNCVLAHGSSNEWVLENMIFQTDGITSCAVSANHGGSYIVNFRFFGGGDVFSSTVLGVNMKNALIDCNSVAGSDVFTDSNLPIRDFNLENIEVINCVRLLTSVVAGVAAGGKLYARNLKFNDTYGTMTGSGKFNLFFEDIYGVVGLNKWFDNKISANNLATTTQSTTTNLRSGGGASNMLITPPTGTGNTGISTKAFPHTYIQLFEMGYYSAASSKTYTLNLISTTTTHWTADPLANELWLECEYYVDSSDADRVIKKSTGVVDFNGSTAWQTLSVTCVPSQAGVVILRAYYGKPVESGKSNWFIIDPTIDVT